MIFWIESVGWVNTPDNCSITLHREKPEECTLSFMSRARGYHVSPNPHLFMVTVDDDGAVSSIISDGFRAESSVCYYECPPAEYLTVGDKLPDSLKEWLDQGR